MDEPETTRSNLKEMRHKYELKQNLIMTGFIFKLILSNSFTYLWYTWTFLLRLI